MTISSDEVLFSGPYVGDGAVTQFDYDFTIFEDSDLLVTVSDALGVETVLTLTTDYTVSGAGTAGGGFFTLTDGALLPTGSTMAASPAIPASQPRSYSTQTSIRLAELEASLDRATALMRQGNGLAERAPKFPVGAVAGALTLEEGAILVAGPGNSIVPGVPASNLADGRTTRTVDTDAGLNVNSDVSVVIHTGTLTQNRTVQLEHAGRFDGSRVLVTRKGVSDFSVFVRDAQTSTLLAQLRDGENVDVVYDVDEWTAVGGNDGAVSAVAFNTLSEILAAEIAANVNVMTVPMVLANPDGTPAQHAVSFVRAPDGLTAATASLQTSDGALWVPQGYITPLHFGGGYNGLKNQADPYLLSDVYNTLAEAQAVYPVATTLSHTVDDMAFQKCVDYMKDTVVLASVGGQIARRTSNNSARDFYIEIPRGVYYLRRSLDLTGISLNFDYKTIHCKGAVILAHVPGKAAIDMIGSRKIKFSGTMTLVGLMDNGTVCRSGFMMGRDAGSAAGSHVFENGISVRGRFSLGPMHLHAAEYVQFNHMHISNDLDPRVHHTQFDTSDDTLTFSSGEAVTWDGGTSSGVVKLANTDTSSGEVAIKVLVGALVDGDVFTGATSGKSATVDGAPVAEPAGEGPGGKSYLALLDGDNYWAMTSDYQTDPTPDVRASFLGCVAQFDARHTGFGDGVWLCAASSVNLKESYVVCTDNDASAYVLFFNTITSMPKIDLSGHIESDGGDTDTATGIGYGISFESATAGRDVNVRGFTWSRNKAQISHSQFRIDASIDTLLLEGDIFVDQIGRDNGQLMFSDPAKVTVHGNLTCYEDGTGPFFNVSSLAGVSGTVYCADVTAANVLHATSSYRLVDLLGNALIRGDEAIAGDLAVTGDATVSGDLAVTGDVDAFGEVAVQMAAAANGDIVFRNTADGNTLARIRYNGASDLFQLLLGGSGTDYTISSTGVTPDTDGTGTEGKSLGSSALKWSQVRAARVYASDFRDANGQIVLTTRGAAIADATADVASVQTTVNLILDRMRSFQPSIAT